MPSLNLPAYTPQSQLLAQLLQQNDGPVYSPVQGVANVASKLAQAYYMKKALDKDQSNQAQLMAAAVSGGGNYQPDSQMPPTPQMQTGSDAQAAGLPQGAPGNAPQMPDGLAAGGVPPIPQQQDTQLQANAPPPIPAGPTGPQTVQQRIQMLAQMVAKNPEMSPGFGQAVQLAQMMQTPKPDYLKLGEGETATPLAANGFQIPGAPVLHGGTKPIAGVVGEAARARDAGVITEAQYQAIVNKEGAAAQGQETWHPAQPDELKARNLPPGTIAQISSNGRIDIVNKAAPGQFLTDQGIGPDATPDDVRTKLMSTETGANLVRQADAVLQGKEELAKISARSGETQGNQLRSVVYALEPGFNPQTGAQRVQLNKELNDTKPTALGGKVGMANALVNHAMDLIDNMIDLKNNSVLGNVGNFVENKVSGASSGSTVKTALRNAETTRGLLAKEQAKFLGGGVSNEASEKEAANNYNINDDLSGTIGAVGSTVTAMREQLQPFVDRWNQAYGTHLDVTDPKFMSPEAGAKLKYLEGVLADTKAGKKIDPAVIQSNIKRIKSGDSTAVAGADAPDPLGIRK